MIATYTSPSARALVGVMVMTFLSVSRAAEKPMSAPLELPVFSLRIPLSSLVEKSPRLLSLWMASAKLSVMVVPVSFTLAPSAGLKVGAATLVSTVKVALAADPWLPAAS